MLGKMPVRSRFLLALAAAAGAASGLATSALIAFINRIHSNGATDTSTLIWFLLIAASIPSGRIAAQTLLTSVAQRAATDMRLQLAARILATDLRSLETVGLDRLITALVDDVVTIAGGMVAVASLCIHIAVIAGCLAYMTWLSPPVAAAVAIFIGAGMTSVQLILRRGSRHFGQARREENELFGQLRALIQGIKELKLHDARRNAFLTTRLYESSRRFQGHVVRASAAFAGGVGLGHLLFFVIMAGILFLAPRVMPVDRAVASGYLITLLYMMSPLDAAGGLLPTIGRTRIAMRNLRSLGLALGLPPGATSSVPPLPRALPLDLRDLVYAYGSESGHAFELGPIDLTINAGEIVFITGGNGSGKTTLLKLLVGLYAPDEGTIVADGVAVTAETRGAYRQQFSVVFADGYLFQDLLGLDRPALDATAQQYLARLELSEKLEIRDGRYSTIDVSEGQRKRLALLTAFLEDRPIYVFDEWAADQDPRFKDVFYRQILPELKQRGKTVIAISHDDRYYDVADRVVKLDEGRLAASATFEPATVAVRGRG